MIIDKLENAQFYYGFGERFEKAFNFLINTNMETLENGKHELDGNELYVSVQDYETKPENEGKFEAHKQYIDIQYIITGEEKLGYENVKNCKETTIYDIEKDIVFLENTKQENEFAKATKGTFLIFMPQDAHMPCIAINEPNYVKKAVVKIKI